MTKIEWLVGRTFGRLTVVSSAGRSLTGKILWKTRCACGAMGQANSGNLKAGSVTQCSDCGRKAVSEKNRQTAIERHRRRAALRVEGGSSQARPSKSPAIKIGLRVNTLDVIDKGVRTHSWTVRCFCCGAEAEVSALALGEGAAVCQPCRSPRAARVAAYQSVHA